MTAICRDGTDTEDLHATLDEWPADVIGVNCSVGPKATLETIERMMRVLAQAAQRHAQRRFAAARGGPQHLSVLARIHGAIRAPPAVGGRAHRGRLLRHHRRAHQADPRRSALAAAACSKKLGVHGGGAAQAKAQAMPKVPVARQNRSWAPSWRPGNSSRSSRFCRRAAWTLPRKSQAPSCAPRTASIASTCRTARAPAPA